MEVYLVFLNNELLGVYKNGPRAVAHLNEVRGRTPAYNWKRLNTFNDVNDPNVQRWTSDQSRVTDRLCVEKETVL